MRFPGTWSRSVVLENQTFSGQRAEVNKSFFLYSLFQAKPCLFGGESDVEVVYVFRAVGRGNV